MSTIEQKIASIRGDFPFFDSNNPNGQWVYLDNAATTHKPRLVIDALMDFYQFYNSNIHRGLYELSEKATSEYENARAKIAQFLNAFDSSEVVFTRGATESMNLLVSCWGAKQLHEGDEVLISEMEHHANIVPWQMVAETTGAKVIPIPIDNNGALDMDFATDRLNSGKVKCLSIVEVSNALGVRNDVKTLIAEGKRNGVFCIVDGSQAVSHFAVDVQALGCDAFVCSGHKMFGPTGIGVLWAKRSILETMPPYQGGGDMIRNVSFEGTTFAEPPGKFEAGTPHIAGAIGLGAAVDYIRSIGFDTIVAIDELLFEKASAMVASIPQLRQVGDTANQLGVVSFYSDTLHPSDLASFLSIDNIAVRTGHHCAQPLMDRLGIPGTVRASFSIYNLPSDIDRLQVSLEKAVQLLG